MGDLAGISTIDGEVLYRKTEDVVADARWIIELGGHARDARLFDFVRQKHALRSVLYDKAGNRNDRQFSRSSYRI